MTVNELVKRADELVKSDIPLERRLEFISEAEGLVGCEILGLALADIPKYTEENTDLELLAAPPHDKLYLPYLAAMLSLYDGDTAAYEGFTSLFNTAFAEYSRYIARRKDKTHSAELDSGIYLSAYAIAVKHGYRGSEAEWLSELDSAVKEAASAASNAENTAVRLEKSLSDCEANIKITADNAEKSEIYAAESYKYSLSVKSLYESTLTSQKIAQSAEASAKSSLENTRTAQAIAQSAEESAKASVENARTAQAIAQAAEKTAKDAADEAQKSASEAKASENAINDRTAALENAVSELDSTLSELETVVSALENRIAELEALTADAQSATAQQTEDEDE